MLMIQSSGIRPMEIFFARCKVCVLSTVFEVLSDNLGKVLCFIALQEEAYITQESAEKVCMLSTDEAKNCNGFDSTSATHNGYR